MDEIIIDKEKLAKIIKKNLKAHEANFEEAWEAFREKAISNFEERLRALKKAEKGIEVNLYVNLSQPQNHADEYQRALEMIALHEEKTVTLSEDEFRELVQDNWNWAREFAGTYLANTGKSLR